MRWIRAFATCASVIAPLVSAAATGEEPRHWIIHDTGAAVEAGPTATVAYSECEGPDEWAECQSVEFGCSDTDGLLSINEDSRGIVAKLTDGNYGEHSQITLRVAATTYRVNVWGIRLWANDLDGHWGVTIEGDGFRPAFEAIAANPAAWVSASVAGTDYDLTARTVDRPRLAAMAKTCSTR